VADDVLKKIEKLSQPGKHLSDARITARHLPTLEVAQTTHVQILLAGRAAPTVRSAAAADFLVMGGDGWSGVR
jgi:hypothetical protein